MQRYVREAYGLEVEAPSYRRFFDYAVNARIPAEFINNRWKFNEADLDEIARTFQLVPMNAVRKQVLEGAAA